MLAINGKIWILVTKIPLFIPCFVTRYFKNWELTTPSYEIAYKKTGIRKFSGLLPFKPSPDPIPPISRPQLKPNPVFKL